MESDWTIMSSAKYGVTSEMLNLTEIDTCGDVVSHLVFGRGSVVSWTSSCGLPLHRRAFVPVR